MKTIKLNKTGRRFWRTTGVLFLLWIAFSVYYYNTWARFRESETNPITTHIALPEYQSQIEQATMHLKGASRRLDVPSFSVAVGHKGKLIWSAAEGYQDLDKGIAATPKTQYRVGSTSKSITATGIAKAIQDNYLSLDTTIGDTIINWPKKEWTFTMRQLLSHTAGIGNYTDFGVASGKYTLCNCYEFNTATEGLNVFNKYDMLYEPGTDFAYSTFDINLASAILEQTTETLFPIYMESTIFTPLGMHDTYADHTRPKSEHFATFYQTEDGWYREYRNFEQVYDVNLSYKWAGGGFISTPTDLVKLGNAWLGDDSFITDDIRREFWTPVRLDNGAVNEQSYALGFRSNFDFTDELLGEGKQSYWIVHHGGVSKGSQNFLLLFPEHDFVINASINANVDSFSKLSAEVKQLAHFFLETLEKKELELYGTITTIN